MIQNDDATPRAPAVAKGSHGLPVRLMNSPVRSQPKNDPALNTVFINPTVATAPFLDIFILYGIQNIYYQTLKHNIIIVHSETILTPVENMPKKNAVPIIGKIFLVQSTSIGINGTVGNFNSYQANSARKRGLVTKRPIIIGAVNGTSLPARLRATASRARARVRMTVPKISKLFGSG